MVSAGMARARAGKPAAGFLNPTIRCQAIHCRARRTWPPQRTELADSQGRPADRRAPGEDDAQAEPELALPRHCASHPSRTCLQTLKANPALSSRARSHHGFTRRCPQIPIGDSSCLITPWCRWTISRISMIADRGYATAGYVAKGHGIRLHLVLLQWSIGANYGISGCTDWLRLRDDLHG
jgi:hypothetical protein